MTIDQYNTVAQARSAVASSYGVPEVRVVILDDEPVFGMFLRRLDIPLEDGDFASLAQVVDTHGRLKTYKRAQNAYDAVMNIAPDLPEITLPKLDAEYAVARVGRTQVFKVIQKS